MGVRGRRSKPVIGDLERELVAHAEEARLAAASLERLFENSRPCPPSERPLKIYAFDPSLGRVVGNRMTTSVRYEELKPGPVGERFEVVDRHAGASGKRVNLDDPQIAMRGGLDPSEADPRFHQQMVYAVASETLQRFEYALGRKIHWRIPKSAKKKPSTPNHPVRLRLFPHGICAANAYYSADDVGIYFGYFVATGDNVGRNLEGQTIFSCLSHDIIAHETAHAIVDSIRSHFVEPSNEDVPAFHEAFADLTALFAHFSYKEALLDTLQRTGGALYQHHLLPEGESVGGPDFQGEAQSANPLVQLAEQFGEAAGLSGGLRSALGTAANPKVLSEKTEAHDRGAILVAAVFDAYFRVYMRRTAKFFRIFFAARGSALLTALPAELAELLALTASQTAEQFFKICVRALDYCPPVDITFGDFLRAVITADTDLHPSDPDGLRDAIIQAFRSRGIVPEQDEARFFSEDALCWSRLKEGDLPPVEGLHFGDPNGLTNDEKAKNRTILTAYAERNAEDLGFDLDRGGIKAQSFHPLSHMAPDGRLFLNMVVELVQTEKKPVDLGELGKVPMRNGVTLLIVQEPVRLGRKPHPWILFCIPKLASEYRRERTRSYARSYYTASALDERRFQIDFAFLHSKNRG